MLLTSSLLSKATFFGSLLNRCRQVIDNLPSKISNNQMINKSNKLPSAPYPSMPIPTVTNNRPAAAAVSFSSPSAGLKTIEEQIGLPPRPKKPLTPYFRFMRDMRPKISSENPKAKALEVVKLISKQWETAEPRLKLSLQEEYKKDQQVYVETRAKYDSKITDDQRSEIKQLKQDLQEAKARKQMRKRVKDLGRPKKPASAFLRFIIKERASTPQLPPQTYREWHKKCTEKWSRISDEEKEVYFKESRVEFEKFKKDILLWEEKMMRSGNIDLVRQCNLIDPEPKPKSKGKAANI